MIPVSRVNSGSVSTTTPSVGSSFTVTVNGSSGTIGGSNIFALSPETGTSFPASSFQLIGTSMTFSNGGTGPAGLGLSGGTVSYTVHATNSGSTAASLDEFIDAVASSPAAEEYVAGSSTFVGGAIADPEINGSTLTWSGTFTVPRRRLR